MIVMIDTQNMVLKGPFISDTREDSVIHAHTSGIFLEKEFFN